MIFGPEQPLILKPGLSFAEPLIGDDGELEILVIDHDKDRIAVYHIKQGKASLLEE